MAKTNPEHFLWELDDEGVAIVTLNRPERKNPLTFESYAELRDTFRSLVDNKDVKAVVITGAGENFCSGGDVHEIIGELLKMDSKTHLDFTRLTCAVIQNMRELRQPIIASVNGIAAGAGSVIALASDFRLLAESASFAFLFTKVGLSGGDMGTAYLLPRLIGLGRATEALMLGEKIKAQEACAIGLANKVVPDDELQASTMELARKLAEGPTEAYANTKRLLVREADMDLHASLELEAVTQAHLMSGQDFHEFYKAFCEKRPPQWQGR